MLGPLERRVMQHLWAHGSRSVGEVLAAVNAGASRELAYTTVMTVLVRLHDKGYVVRDKEGRHFRYAPAFPEASLPAEVGRRELSRLIARYGAASVVGFAAELAEPDLAERLAKLAASDRADQ